jgi:hypothetical protein
LRSASVMVPFAACTAATVKFAARLRIAGHEFGVRD